MPKPRTDFIPHTPLNEYKDYKDPYSPKRNAIRDIIRKELESQKVVSSNYDRLIEELSELYLTISWLYSKGSRFHYRENKKKLVEAKQTNNFLNFFKMHIDYNIEKKKNLEGVEIIIKDIGNKKNKPVILSSKYFPFILSDIFHVVVESDFAFTDQKKIDKPKESDIFKRALPFHYPRIKSLIDKKNSDRSTSKLICDVLKKFDVILKEESCRKYIKKNS